MPFSHRERAIFMPTNDNHQSITNRRLKIDGQQIPVTEEVYRAYKQPLWAEHKRKERKKRCITGNGKGGTKRCTKDCRTCEKKREGSILSLDKFADDGYEVTDTVDLFELVSDKLLLEQLVS